MAYKDRGGFYRPKYSHNLHRDAEIERTMEDITDLAVLAVKVATSKKAPMIGEALDNIVDTFDMIAPKNPLNGGSASLRPFDNILFNNFVPTKAKLNSALRNQSILNSNNNNSSSVILNSNMVNNNFVNQMTTNAMNILNNPPTMRPPKRR